MTLTVWRHPKPIGAEGRCIGRTDLPVDRRKAKRLAHRIRAWARRRGAPREVATSPLRRGRDVGRWLARWGWRHRVVADLAEIDFGDWDGLDWDRIGAPAVDAWCADFASHAPGGGEPVSALLARCRRARTGLSGCMVGHAGWISAALWLDDRGSLAPRAVDWPAAVRHGQRVDLRD